MGRKKDANVGNEAKILWGRETTQNWHKKGSILSLSAWSSLCYFRPLHLHLSFNLLIHSQKPRFLLLLSSRTDHLLSPNGGNLIWETYFSPSLKVKAAFSCCSLIISVKSFSSGSGRNRHGLFWHWSSVAKDSSIKGTHVKNVHLILQKKCNHTSLLWGRCS